MDEEVKIEGNIDINQALKEFELKTNAGQIKKNVTEEKKYSEIPKMIRLVMKWSGVKEQKQAEYILLGFVVIAIGVSLFLFFRENQTQQNLPAATLKELNRMPVNNH